MSLLLHPCPHPGTASKHSAGSFYFGTYVHTYMRTCLHAYMLKCVHAHLRTCVHTYIRTYVHTYIHTYIRAEVHMYIRTYLHAHIPTCVHVYIRTYRIHIVRTCISRDRRVVAIILCGCCQLVGETSKKPPSSFETYLNRLVSRKCYMFGVQLSEQ